MHIVSRFIIDDGSVGYILNDQGLEYPVMERYLYDQSVLEGLIASNYKIMDYHGTIITPEGICIKDLVNEVCTASEYELQRIMDMADYALTEAEATKYFSRDVEIKEVALRNPKVSIHTREELMSYLDKVCISMKYSTTVVDVRPLNSFVAREALFTVEELVSSPAVKEYFRIIEMRRKLNSYSNYKKLIEYLKSEGVLAEEHTPDDVKAAYLAWGICGIKTAITDTYVKVGVTSSIYEINEQMEGLDSTTGRTKEFCLLSKDGVAHYLGGKCDLTDDDGTINAVVTPVNGEDYWNAMGSTSRWESEYKVLPCFIVRPKNRTYYKLMDENGLTFKVKADLNRIVIMDTRSVLYVGEFLHARCMDGSYAALDRLVSEEVYVRWNLTRAKARELVQAKTTKPPVDNSYSLCVEEGVTPENAINYIARRITDNTDLNADLQDGINYYDAADLYRRGPNKDLIKKYNPDNIEYDSIDELIDIMCGTREELIESNEYLQISKQDKSISAQSVREELQTRPLEQLEFAKNCKDGRIAADYLGTGLRSDGMVDITEVADLLELIMRQSSGESKLQIGSIIELLSNVSGLDDVIRERDSAFKGYLKDRSILNATRANQCAAAVYITRIYREAANVQIEDQRHYMFDCISLNLTDKKRGKAVSVQREITAAVEAAFSKRRDIPFTYREACTLEAPSIALKLMFKIAMQKVNVVSRDSEGITISEVYNLGEGEGIDLRIIIKESVFNTAGERQLYDVNKCCTLYDWCQLEMTSLAFNLYCLNANITPWKVTPKKGVEIPTYNFALNYMYFDTIKALSQGFQDKVKNEGAKVREFVNTYISDYLLEGDLLEEATSYKLETINGVLHPNVNESVGNYHSRFAMLNKAAGDVGKYLKRMRLKSDVVYKAYADKYSACEALEDEDIYEVMSDAAQSKLWITTTTPMFANKIVNERLITGAQNIVSMFSIVEEKFTDITRWMDLVYDKFVPAAVCITTGTKLVCVGPNIGKIVLDLKAMSREEAAKMAVMGIFYQLSAREYLLITSSGKLRLEVKNA